MCSSDLRRGAGLEARWLKLVEIGVLKMKLAILKFGAKNWSVAMRGGVCMGRRAAWKWRETRRAGI